MEARDELLAVVQRAVGDDAAQRCTAALNAQGVGAVVDWFVLETADEDLCRDLLSDVAAAEKLTRVQVAKLRLALRGQSARFYPARLSDEEGERRPLWSSFRRYTLPNPLEVAFVFTNRPGWYRAVFDALDGHRLREAYMEQSQIFMLVSVRHQCHIIPRTPDLDRVGPPAGRPAHPDRLRPGPRPGARAAAAHHMPLAQPERLLHRVLRRAVPALRAPRVPARARRQPARRPPEHADVARDALCGIKSLRRVSSSRRPPPGRTG